MEINRTSSLRAGAPNGDAHRTMPRKATSPAEFEQVARIRSLLGNLRLHPSPDLHVTTAGQKTYRGQLVRDQVGNNARKGGRWAYYGTVVLLTQEGEVEIDYLDIVLVEPRDPSAPSDPPDGVAPCEPHDGSGMLPA
jgi:hypothetical protein